LLGDILQEFKPIKTELKEQEKYQELTVKLNGLGVRKRGESSRQDYIYGSQVKSARWKMENNCLVVSKIDARSGGIGWISESYDYPLITTKNFMFFKIKKDYQWINPYFLVSYLTTDFYQDYFDDWSQGTTTKRYLYSKEFLATKIQLTGEELKQKSLEFTRQQELELELELATVRSKIKEIIAKK